MTAAISARIVARRTYTVLAIARRHGLMFSKLLQRKVDHGRT